MSTVTFMPPTVSTLLIGLVGIILVVLMFSPSLVFADSSDTEHGHDEATYHSRSVRLIPLTRESSYLPWLFLLS